MVSLCQESLREEVTPYEFLCFILTQNESVSMDEIKEIMANFSELDVTKRGLLTQHTVDEWLRPPDGDPMGGWRPESSTPWPPWPFLKNLGQHF